MKPEGEGNGSPLPSFPKEGEKDITNFSGWQVGTRCHRCGQYSSEDSFKDKQDHDICGDCADGEWISLVFPDKCADREWLSRVLMWTEKD